MGAGYLGWKYGVDTSAAAREMAAIEEALDALRAALGGRPTILDAFSYADVVMTVALQVLEPASEPCVRIGEATRAVWRNPELAARYADLLAYREPLLRAHHPRSAG